MRTQRLTILVTPQEREAISRKAVALGVSDSEFVRLAVDAYSDSEDRDALIALSQEVSKAAVAMSEDLARAHRAVQAMFADKAAAREEREAA